MAIDILSYTACKEIVYANTCCGCLVNIVTSKLTCLTPNNAHEVWRWACHGNEITGYTGLANVLCVYPTGANYCNGSGFCCLWTVPAGATKVKFEIWGPGGPGGTGNCCGSAPPGSSGSYISFTIPATPGCQYTLCAASSNTHCPYCCGCSNYWPQCYCSPTASFVQGFGLCNVCARGGYLDYVQNMCARLCRIGFSVQGGTTSAPLPCRFINEYYFAVSPNSCGPCICYCVSICQSSQPTYQMSPVADWNIWPCGCITIGLCQYTPILRIPSIHSGQNMDTNNYGTWFIMPPLYPIAGLQNAGINGCTENIYAQAMSYAVSSSSCQVCGLSWAMYCCCMPIPGMPGHGTHAMGGCTAMYGDRGRNGAVKVSWSGNANTTFRCSN